MPVPQSAAVKAALFALRIYKVYLSAFLGGTCRFQPTCSQYMYEAIERFGLRRGVWLGTKRLARCHPFSRRFVHDPVPGPHELEDHELQDEESLRHLSASVESNSAKSPSLALRHIQQIGQRIRQPQIGARP
jgi:putative membrane protein insertion efficiency factor